MPCGFDEFDHVMWQYRYNSDAEGWANVCARFIPREKVVNVVA
jgi:hypothetical protein